ncbi:helix-turn-helix domain-containing protein [Leucobacter denitrificans]|uniref:AraC family transcriptional regulator n=1 Tax=Leucobacter denitrificans TaxID=683042 RepID=A0A7G9S3F8_9MICO|nr:helix-turn-helix domain-containing protein [Leucobacter denitrificans]QNN62383.1 AraC family transcriptional regulator [Leucobacter denitrificans]
MSQSESSARGILYPSRLPEFHRLQAPESLAHAVRWFWIPVWDLPHGVQSRQEILPFPACNLVVESAGGASTGRVSFVGPPTRRSERVLEGQGWAVGALLRPAAAHALHAQLPSVRDTEVIVNAPDLLAKVVAAMDRNASSGLEDAGDPLNRAGQRELAAAALGAWIHNRVPAASARSATDKLANRMSELLLDASITRVDQLADRLGTSARTVQRIADQYFGLPPLSMIRRRRLQESAERLSADANLSLADLAAELGYSDHAHFTNDFTAVLGLTPTQYRGIESSPRKGSP